MRTLSTNEYGDIYLVAGKLAISKDLDAVRVACECAARTQSKEVVFDIERGVAYDASVFSQTNITIFEQSLRKALLGVPNVIAIKSLNIDFNDNTIKYTAEIESIYGDAAAHGSL